MAKTPKEKKPDNRVQIRVVDPNWVTRVNLWRRRQPDPIPNFSEAVRTLTDIGLESEKPKRPPTHTEKKGRRE